MMDLVQGTLVLMLMAYWIGPCILNMIRWVIFICKDTRICMHIGICMQKWVTGKKRHGVAAKEFHVTCKHKERHYSKLEDEKSSSLWSKQLPEDIAQLILERLSMSDYVRFGAVCRSWHSITKSRRCRALQLPWLMLCPLPFSNIDKFFLSLSDWKVHDLLSPLNPIWFHINRVDCAGSIEGWLIMTHYRPVLNTENFLWNLIMRTYQTMFKTENFFWNPISGARVKLPSSQSTLACRCKNSHGSIVKFVASSGPTTSKQPCLVVSLCKFGHLAFCRPTDKSWTSIDVGKLYFHDMVIMGGKLYAATKEASKYLMVFDIIHEVDGNSNGNGSHRIPSYRAEKLVILHPWPVISLSDSVFADGEFIRLVVDSASKELFMILHKVILVLVAQHSSQQNYHPTKEFRVFKLECNNANGDPRWVEVVDLGDRILFVSKDVKFISTNNSAHSYGPDGETLERNSIYFAMDYPLLESSLPDFGVFSLTNKSIRHLTFPDGCYSGPDLYTRPVWFTPNPW